MLMIDRMEDTVLRKIRTACAFLFSPQLARDDGFVRSLELETVKSAFREKAKLYHPDYHRPDPHRPGYPRSEKMIDWRKERFIKIRESYEILVSNLQEKPEPFSGERAGQRKIIAVGGAKGGIGKSIFAANLGALLSSMGWKTVAIDLDLGGANLHLYLGETSLKWNINDFLDRRVPTLETIMVGSKYGPRLIGGDSSHLGAANIGFLQKQKLLKALRRIDADYVVIDLGGDTSYNIADFFLAADYGIVMTTCDPASYLDAYNFIKVALYRKLNRLFGPESMFRGQRDSDLEKLIYEATRSPNGSNVKSIKELMERVKRQQSHNLHLITKAISTFSPYLLVNQVRQKSDAIQVVKRIREVSEEMLSIQVEYLGNLPYQSEIEYSARELVPVVSRYPGGDLAKNIGRIVEELLHR